MVKIKIFKLFLILIVIFLTIQFSFDNVTDTIPTHSTPLLISSLGTNYTNENLTCYNQSTFDADEEKVTNIYNWYKNNEAINNLYLPFEINTNDYSKSGNDGIAYGGNFVSGKVGNGLELNGTEYVKITDKPQLDFTNKKTWEIWFKENR